MSDDGADLNMPAAGAMKAALGGDQPERLSDEAFEAMIRQATDAGSYDGCANVAARAVLEHLEAHPEHLALDAEGGLYDHVKASASAEAKAAFSEMTGFMWGWAVNAARHILKQKPVPNPAIVEIG